MADQHPAFGRQRIKLLTDGTIVVLAVSSTFVPAYGEGRDCFLGRIQKENKITEMDEVEVVFRHGRVHHAIVRWSIPA